MLDGLRVIGVQGVPCLDDRLVGSVTRRLMDATVGGFEDVVAHAPPVVPELGTEADERSAVQNASLFRKSRKFLGRSKRSIGFVPLSLKEYDSQNRSQGKSPENRLLK